MCALFSALLSLSSCNGGSNTANNNATQQIALSVQSSSHIYFPAVKCLIHGGSGYLRLDAPSKVAKNTSTQLKAELICLDNVKFDVTKSGVWSEQKDSIAEVSKTGVLTTYKSGATKIVYFDRTLNHSVMADVQVTNAEVTELSISSDGTSYVAGEKVKLQAYASFSDGEQGRYLNSDLVKWNSSNNDVANVDKDGVLALHKTGNAIITVDYAGKTSQLIVDVEPAKIKTISIANKDLTLDALITNEVQITAEATLSNQEKLAIDNDSLQCSSSNPKLLKFSESQNCLLEVVDPKKTGSAEITVKYKDFNDVQTIKVTTDRISDIKAELNTDGLLPNTSRGYKIYAVHKSVLGKEIIYDVTNNLDVISSDDNIVSIKDNAIHTHKPGTVTLTTRFGEDKDAKSYSMQVTVGSIDLQTPSELPKGTTEQVQVRTIDAKNVAHDVTSTSIITSSNSSILSVVNNKLIAHSEGTVKIKATLPSGEFSEKEIKVTPAIIKSIEISGLSDTINVGYTKELQLNATYSDNRILQVADKEHVKWSASPADIISISNDGVITPKQIGVAKIDVEYHGYKATGSINIDAAQIVGMEINPKELDLVGLIGDSKQIAAELIYSDAGREALDNDKLKCTSSNPSIAKVEADCKIVALNTGNATIAVSYDKYTQNVPVKVGSNKIDSIALIADTNNLLEDEKRAYTIDATVGDKHYDVTNSLVVISSDSSVLDVDAVNKQLVAKRVGQSTISIKYDGKTYANRTVNVARGKIINVELNLNGNSWTGLNMLLRLAVIHLILALNIMMQNVLLN